MSVDLTKENVNLGKVAYQWTVREYEKYDRSARWYWLMGIAGVGLLVYALLAANYLFAMILVLFAIIMFMFQMQEPGEVPFAITETGVVVGNRFYRFSEFSGFWLIYNPPDVKNLYFSLNSLLKHRLQIPLMDYDPRPIRDFLNQYLSENLEEEDEPLTDKMARVLRLH